MTGPKCQVHYTHRGYFLILFVQRIPGVVWMDPLSCTYPMSHFPRDQGLLVVQVSFWSPSQPVGYYDLYITSVGYVDIILHRLSYVCYIIIKLFFSKLP